MTAPARLRLFYFVYYGYVGTYLPHFAAYLRGLGFTGEQIGAAQTIPSLLAPAVAMGWAAWADRVGTPARALRRAATWSAVVVLALPFARTPALLGAVLVAFALGDRAVVPLVDSLTLDWTRRHPGSSYARIRLWGSIGFVVLAVGTGALLSARGNRAGDAIVPFAAAACIVGYAVCARRLPASAPAARRPDRADLVALLRDRKLLLLVGASAVHWAACAPYHLFFGVLVRDLGLPAHVTGLAMGVGVAGELAALLLFPRIAAGRSVRALFAAVFAVSAARWLLVSAIGSAVPLVAVQLLHGITFGLFWATAMQAMGELVPAHLRATGQAVFSAIVFGAGNSAGYFLSGVGYDRLGGAGPLFAAAAAVELVPLALIVLRQLPQRPRPEPLA